MGLNLSDPRALYREMRSHVGHDVVLTRYVNGVNLAIECETCNEVLLDVDPPRDPAYAECQNCGATWKQDEMDPIDDVAQRVAAGEVFPAGQCPACYALCHLMD